MSDWGRGKGYIWGDSVRRLRILAPTPHNHISRASLGLLGPLITLLALRRLLEESHRRAGHPAHIAPRVRTDNAQKTLTSFLGQIWFFEHALCAVDVG